MEINVFKLIVWLLSIAYTQYYLYGIIKKRYGVTSSISYSAKKVKLDGQPWLFATFILGTTIPLALIGADLGTIAAAVTLSIISVFTGYNDEIKDDKFENTMHVVCTMLAIGMSFLWMLSQSLFYIVPLAAFGVFTYRMTKNKVKNHTWWIEEFARYLIYFAMLVERVIV